MNKLTTFRFFFKLYHAFGHSFVGAARLALREARKPLPF